MTKSRENDRNAVSVFDRNKKKLYNKKKSFPFSLYLTIQTSHAVGENSLKDQNSTPMIFLSMFDKILYVF
jgi:hypothetical protein